jgi:hypothetical protein
MLAQAWSLWEEEADGPAPPIGRRERENGTRAAVAAVLGHRLVRAGGETGEGNRLCCKPKGEGEGEEAQWPIFYFPFSLSISLTPIMLLGMVQNAILKVEVPPNVQQAIKQSRTEGS